MEPIGQHSPAPAAIRRQAQACTGQRFQGPERSNQLNLERRKKQAGSYKGLKGVQTIQCVYGMNFCSLHPWGSVHWSMTRMKPVTGRGPPRAAPSYSFLNTETPLWSHFFGSEPWSHISRGCVSQGQWRGQQETNQPDVREERKTCLLLFMKKKLGCLFFST